MSTTSTSSTISTGQRGYRIASECYPYYNNVFLAFQPFGFTPSICGQENYWIKHYKSATACTSATPATISRSLDPVDIIYSLISYCNLPGKRDVPTTTLTQHLSSTPRNAARQAPSTTTSSTPSGSAIIVISTTNLIPCPARTVNPTYTPTTSLPSDYVWGCPPKLVCAPPQVGCNWNVAPAASYICRPEHYIKLVGDPPFLSNQWLSQWDESRNSNEISPPFPQSGNWTNLDPQFWGFDISQFLTTVNVTTYNSTTSASSSLLLTSTSISPTNSTPAFEGSSSKAWIAGEVIGLIAVVLGMLLLGSLILRHRKRQRQRRLQDEAKIEASREKSKNLTLRHRGKSWKAELRHMNLGRITSRLN